MTNKNFDDGFEQAPSNWLKWGKIGNVIKGVYVGYYDKKDDKGETQRIYEIKAIAGEFNDIIKTIPQEKTTTLTEGEVYQVGGKTIIDRAMKNVKIGQKVIMRFISEFKVPKGMAKTIEVKVGGMDEDFVKEQEKEFVKPEDIDFN